MKLIVGLGNIGRQFKNTPHNVGFEFLDVLRKHFIDIGFDCDIWKNEQMFFSQISKVRKGGPIEYILAKPTTYMNLSGKAVAKLVEKFKPTEVIIIHDDLDIKIGEYKIQVGKGPKDHNGVLSIEDVKGSEKFLRVRVGVESRKDKTKMPGDIYVIKKLGYLELDKLNEGISKSLAELTPLLLN